jgi:hypothetical protein
VRHITIVHSNFRIIIIDLTIGEQYMPCQQHNLVLLWLNMRTHFFVYSIKGTVNSKLTFSNKQVIVANGYRIHTGRKFAA